MAGRKENLKPKTSPQARGKLGGIKSVQVRKEKKLMSQIYADILADQAGIKKGQGIKKVVEEILNSRDPRATSSRVALMRELREGTEGNKMLLGNDPDKPFDMVINIVGVKSKDE